MKKPPKIKKRVIIDRPNAIEMTIYFHGELNTTGPRYGFELAVKGTDPFVEWPYSSDGFCSAAAAERYARKIWASFRVGDELCRGVLRR